MNETLSKPLSQSSTFRWVVVAVLTFLVNKYGIPALPAEVLGEFTGLVGLAADAAFAACMALAVRGRMKAREIIRGVW